MSQFADYGPTDLPTGFSPLFEILTKESINMFKLITYWFHSNMDSKKAQHLVKLHISLQTLFLKHGIRKCT
jgi:hypothetical protein